MAQNGQQENIKGVGAVGDAGAAGKTQQAAQTTQKAEAAPARQAQGNEAQGNQQLPANIPAEDVTLTADAEKDLEEKRLEEEKKLQQQIDELETQIEDTKLQIQQAEEAGDKQKVANLTDQLHGLQDQLGGLIDQPAVQQHNPAKSLGSTPQLIPPPVGGGFNMGNAGGFNPYTFGGNPALGLPAGVGGNRGGLSGANFAPRADPSVNIPDYGRGANKAQIGEMLDAASKKYGIPPNILKAVAWQESGWNPKALSFDGQHGKGVMQIDDRFHDFAKTPEVFDPAKNIDYGAKFLAEKYQQTGSWQGALKRYNGGDAYPPKVLALAEQQPWQKYA